MADLKVGFYGHVRQYHDLKEEIDRAIHEVLESGSYVLGPQLTEFERELAQYINLQETVGLNSGTDALVLAFLALGLGPGDEIITTSNTFFATAEAIWLIGATPVLIDSESKTHNLDARKLEAAITPKTRAIVPVHLYGLPADMPAIAKIAKKNGLSVIEDCAQGIGARGDIFVIGEHSDAVCLSFIIQKNLGCFGDGGAVATNNAELAARIRKLRNHGSLKRSHHSIGYNSRLDDLHAAVLRVKLRKVDEWSAKRRALARIYDAALADTPLRLPYTPEGYEHVFHLYVVECGDRDGLQAHLAARGITALTHYPIAIHQQEGFPWGRPVRVHSQTVTEKSAATVLSLPMYPELTREEIDAVCRETLAWCATSGARAVQARWARAMAATRKYSVAIHGTGKRGRVHIEYFHRDERFQVVGISGRDPARLAAAAALAANPATFLDPAEMLRATKPDVFCFCTPPSVRLGMIRAGIDGGVKLIAYEKPMATSFNEALEITELCRKAGVKTVVSHQIKYGEHFQKVREIIASGAIGRVHTVYGTTLGWLLQMGTHVMDYVRYFNGEAEAEWAYGQASGTEKFADSHPSPDFVLGEVQFANGVRGILEIGNLAQDVPEVEYFWHKVRIGAQGTEGFAEALIGGGWRAVTRDSGGPISGPGKWDAQHDQPPYIRDMALWLDDPARVHPCNSESAFKGFEILMAMIRSAIDRQKITMPLAPAENEITHLERVLRA